MEQQHKVDKHNLPKHVKRLLATNFKKITSTIATPTTTTASSNQATIIFSDHKTTKMEMPKQIVDDERVMARMPVIILILQNTRHPQPHHHCLCL
jgi:hypothetical protein